MSAGTSTVTGTVTGLLSYRSGRKYSLTYKSPAQSVQSVQGAAGNAVRRSRAVITGG